MKILHRCIALALGVCLAAESATPVARSEQCVPRFSDGRATQYALRITLDDSSAFGEQALAEPEISNHIHMVVGILVVTSGILGYGWAHHDLIANWIHYASAALQDLHVWRTLVRSRLKIGEVVAMAPVYSFNWPGRQTMDLTGNLNQKAVYLLSLAAKIKALGNALVEGFTMEQISARCTPAGRKLIYEGVQNLRNNGVLYERDSGKVLYLSERGKNILFALRKSSPRQNKVLETTIIESLRQAGEGRAGTPAPERAAQPRAGGILFTRDVRMDPPRIIALTLQRADLLEESVRISVAEDMAAWKGSADPTGHASLVDALRIQPEHRNEEQKILLSNYWIACRSQSTVAGYAMIASGAPRIGSIAVRPPGAKMAERYPDLHRDLLRSALQIKAGTSSSSVRVTRLEQATIHALKPFAGKALEGGIVDLNFSQIRTLVADYRRDQGALQDLYRPEQAEQKKPAAKKNPRPSPSPTATKPKPPTAIAGLQERRNEKLNDAIKAGDKAVIRKQVLNVIPPLETEQYIRQTIIGAFRAGFDAVRAPASGIEDSVDWLFDRIVHYTMGDHGEVYVIKDETLKLQGITTDQEEFLRKVFYRWLNNAHTKSNESLREFLIRMAEEGVGAGIEYFDELKELMEDITRMHREHNRQILDGERKMKDKPLGTAAKTSELPAADNLLRRLRNDSNDENALNEMRKIASQAIRHFRQIPADEREGVVQETLMKVRNAIRKNRAKGRDSPSWLVVRAAQRTAIDYLKKNKRASFISTLDNPNIAGQLQSLAPSPEQAALDSEWAEIIRVALDALKKSHPAVHVVVDLYYFGGLQLAEIAKQLDIPVGTVKSSPFYGRLYLGRQLRRYYGESPLFKYSRGAA